MKKKKRKRSVEDGPPAPKKEPIVLGQWSGWEVPETAATAAAMAAAEAAAAEKAAAEAAALAAAAIERERRSSSSSSSSGGGGSGGSDGRPAVYSSISEASGGANPLDGKGGHAVTGGLGSKEASAAAAKAKAKAKAARAKAEEAKVEAEAAGGGAPPPQPPQGGEAAALPPPSRVDAALAAGRSDEVIMSFAQGETCVGGVVRAAAATVRCHAAGVAVLEMHEDGLCKYDLVIGTPTACSATRAGVLDADATAIEEALAALAR